MKLRCICDNRQTVLTGVRDIKPKTSIFFRVKACSTCVKDDFLFQTRADSKNFTLLVRPTAPGLTHTSVLTCPMGHGAMSGVMHQVGGARDTVQPPQCPGLPQPLEDHPHVQCRNREALLYLSKTCSSLGGPIPAPPGPLSKQVPADPSLIPQAPRWRVGG